LRQTGSQGLRERSAPASRTPPTRLPGAHARRPDIFLHIKENVLDISFFTLYAHQMSNPPAAAGLAFQPRKGFGARVASGFSRVGTALQSAVASGLRRSKCDPDRRTTPDADKPAAARQAHAPRPPSRTRTGVLARLFRRRRTVAVRPEQSHELSDSDVIDEAFPDLCPEARAFFNTPLDECDPELLGIVLEALAEVIARTMAPQEGMSDARDVFLALRGRLAAVQGEPGGAPPAALPEAAGAPADSAAAATMDPQAASPEFSGTALAPDLAAPQSDEADVALHASAPATAAPDQPATGPVAFRPSGPAVSDTSTENARAPNSRRVPPRHSWRRLVRARPGFATRRRAFQRQNVLFRGHYVVRSLPRPPRLFCYAACAGPPALLRRA
jgi:hypothetical protein